VRNCLPFLQTLRLALRRELRLRRLAARVGGAQTLVIRDRRVGFFSVYFQVLGALALCERTGRRLILRFDRGLYFDPARPEAGWFDYFFDTLPPLLPAGGQIPGDACTLFNEGDLVELARLGESLPRRRAFGLSRLLPPRPCVTQIVQPHLDRFAACGLVLGIHYRGTDKVHNAVEALRTGYAEVLGIVRELERRGLCFHVFLATDEQRFADALREAWASASSWPRPRGGWISRSTLASPAAPPTAWGWRRSVMPSSFPAVTSRPHRVEPFAGFALLQPVSGVDQRLAVPLRQAGPRPPCGQGRARTIQGRGQASGPDVASTE
jgi:hypothetical protein